MWQNWACLVKYYGLVKDSIYSKLKEAATKAGYLRNDSNNIANVVILRKTYFNLKNIMGTFVYTLPIGKCKTFYGCNL